MQHWLVLEKKRERREINFCRFDKDYLITFLYMELDHYKSNYQSFKLIYCTITLNSKVGQEEVFMSFIIVILVFSFNLI